MASHHQQLESKLKERKVWPTKGAIIDGVMKTSDGEVVIALDMCDHIGRASNELRDKKLRQSDFQSQLEMGKLEKIYLHGCLNEFNEKGRKKVVQFISNVFDNCGGGVTVVGTGKGRVVFGCLRNKPHKPKEKDPTKKSRDTLLANQTAKKKIVCGVLRFISNLLDSPCKVDTTFTATGAVTVITHAIYRRNHMK